MIAHPPRSVLISTIIHRPNLHIHQLNDAQLFRAAIIEAKKINSHSAYVHLCDETEYANGKMFMINDGTAMVAVKSNGTIVSVIKNPKLAKHDGLRHINRELMLTALRHGGNQIDCFDGFPPRLYARFGFFPVCRLAFDDEFAPTDWNFDRDGRPDIIFMIHNGDRLATVESKHDHGRFPPYDQLLYSPPLVSDYTEAMNLVSMKQTALQNRLRAERETQFYD